MQGVEEEDVETVSLVWMGRCDRQNIFEKKMKKNNSGKKKYDRDMEHAGNAGHVGTACGGLEPALFLVVPSPRRVDSELLMPDRRHPPPLSWPHT